MNWKTLFILFFISLTACERPEPQYVLKAEVGESAIPIWEDLAEDPKIIKVKRSDIDKQRDMEKMRDARKEKRGIHVSSNPWDR